VLVTKVSNLEQYGVVEFDSEGGVSKLVDKPKEPKTTSAVIAIYAVGGGAASTPHTKLLDSSGSSRLVMG
jgi:dTDP-glucose pyrophosphorylase